METGLTEPLRHSVLRSSRIVAAVGALLIAVILLGSMAVIVHRQANELRDAEREIANVARILTQEMSRSFEAVDLVIREVAAKVVQIAPTPNAAALLREDSGFRQLLSGTTVGLPQLHAVALISTDGTLVASSDPGPLPTVNVASRQYFKALMADRSDKPVISVPIRNRRDGAWTLYLARRIATPRGDAVGIAIGTIRLAFFENAFQAVDLGAGASIALAQLDGTILARFPPSPSSEEGPTIDRALLEGLGGRDAATGLGRQDGDPRDRVVSAQKMVAYPLAIAVSRPVAAILEDPRHDAIRIMTGAALASGALAILLWLLVAVLRRQERFETALAASEQRFKDFASCSADGFWETDAEDRFVYVSGKISGMPIAARGMVRRTRYDIARREKIDPESEESFAAYRKVVASRAPYRNLELWTRRAGNRLVLLLSGTPVFGDDGEFLGYRGISRDITETALNSEALTAAKEKAEAATRARTAFLANMSHEIRNPLNGVIGLARMLSEAPLDANNQHLAVTLRNSAEHLMQLIDDVLDLSRIEAAQFSLDEVPLDIRQTVESVRDLLRPQADAKKLVLTCALAADVPVHAAGDPVRLRQVLLNLAGNALKFTADGSVSIAVTLEQMGDTEITLGFVVRDTGPGIAPEAITRLFKQFSQGSIAIAHQYGGTGLGLAICRQLVRAMGGEIRVESRVGEGSVFHFTARLRRVANARIASAAKPLPLAARRRPINVLLAEDDTVNQLVAINLLQKLGCRVDVVTNGRAAIEAVGAQSYDVIVMDTVMPEMDGLEATRAIRQQDGASSTVPIIAMTASACVEDRADCLAAGADHFIAKPMSLHQLAAALAEAVRVASDDRNDAAVSDAVDIDSVFANLGEAADELIAIFLAETEARLDRMRRLRRPLDKPVLVREAHSLKSAAATFGCRGLSELAADLEEGVAARGADGLDEAIDAMKTEFERARLLLSAAVEATRQAA